MDDDIKRIVTEVDGSGLDWGTVSKLLTAANDRLRLARAHGEERRIDEALDHVRVVEGSALYLLRAARDLPTYDPANPAHRTLLINALVDHGITTPRLAVKLQASGRADEAICYAVLDRAQRDVDVAAAEHKKYLAQYGESLFLTERADERFDAVASELRAVEATLIDAACNRAEGREPRVGLPQPAPASGKVAVRKVTPRASARRRLTMVLASLVLTTGGTGVLVAGPAGAVTALPAVVVATVAVSRRTAGQAASPAVAMLPAAAPSDPTLPELDTSMLDALERAASNQAQLLRSAVHQMVGTGRLLAAHPMRQHLDPRARVDLDALLGSDLDDLLRAAPQWGDDTEKALVAFSLVTGAMERWRVQLDTLKPKPLDSVVNFLQDKHGVSTLTITDP